ncbi:hypothetical protein B0H13DRAFT_2661914 [Mycena leptocephala]|nr:hypothetical protein B0H13DRAFT_2661914 [Mycena leptocephala]
MDPVVSLNLDTTLGVAEIGILLSYALFGVMTTQAYTYYSRFPDDSRKLKALVAFIWLCEFAHAVCAGQTLYVYTIANYGHPERLLGPAPKSLATANFFSGVIGACVQGFFSYRIYAFSKKLFIPSLTWVMAFLRMLSGIVVFYIALRMTSLHDSETQWATILLCQRTYAQKRTLALVDKLVAWTIETGMLTSAMTIATLICFLAMKDKLIWVTICMIEARMFSNSLLASLNSRATLRAMNEVSGLPSLHLTAAETQMALPNGVQITQVTQIASNVELSRVQFGETATEMENKASFEQNNYVVLNVINPPC